MTKSDDRLFSLGAVETRHGRFASGDAKVEGLFKCPDCGSARWLLSCNTHRKGFSGRCHGCSSKKNAVLAQRPEHKVNGEQHHFFKRGFWTNASGYLEVSLPGTDIRRKFTVRGRGKILFHRLVMSESLGRMLKSWEHVHHKDGDKQNNNLENLEIVSNTAHATITQLVKENTALRAEIERLKI